MDSLHYPYRFCEFSIGPSPEVCHLPRKRIWDDRSDSSCLLELTNVDHSRPLFLTGKVTAKFLHRFLSTAIHEHLHIRSSVVDLEKYVNM